MDDSTRKFMTLKEVAERYAVSYQTVWSMAREGRLPAFQIGGTGSWRVSREKLEQYEQTPFEAGTR